MKAPPKRTEVAVAQAPLIRSEGQRMLLHVSGSLAAIAEALSIRSPQSVLDWRNGVRVPVASARAQMQVVLGIPVEAWSRLPASHEAELAAAAATTVDEPREAMPALDETLELLAVIRRDRNTPGLMPSERTKLVDAEARILKLRADLEQRAELSEERYVREHPAWLRVRNELARVLVQFPAAARAVAEALERMEL